MTDPVVERWFRYMESGDRVLLEELLHDDIVFHSPAVFTPQVGVAKARTYLVAAERMFANASFRYIAQWFADQSAVLEFTADLDGVHINGVDIIQWNSDGKITGFKVMVRPLKAIQTIVPIMGNLLEQ